MNDTHHTDVAVTQRDGQRVVILRRNLGTLAAEPIVAPLPEGPAILSVRAEPEWYHFSAHASDGAVIDLGRAETRHLSTELARGFTGVYLGMYATGNGTDSTGIAHFDRFEYTPGTPADK